MWIFRIVLCFLIVQACSNKTENKANLYHDSIQNTYANGFRIIDHNSYKSIQVINPYQDAKNIVIEYKLTSEKNQKDISNNVIEVPVKRVICMSVSHISFLEKLNELNSIKAVSGNFTSNEIIQQKLTKNEIFDIGYEQSINYEKILQIKPDVIFAYGVREDVSGYIGKLQELGIPVVLVGEFLENNPLARAEWVKFFAAFFNKDSVGSAVFNAISNRYENLKLLASKAKDKPKVMVNVPWNGSWYIPGRNSFLATLIKDAGGDYIWKNTGSNESMPMDIEKVFTESLNSDVWLNSGQATTLSDIIAIDPRLQNLKPFKTKAIFNNNARLSKTGGNDFWESGTLNPDIVLEDLIVILHPDLLPDHKLFYYRKLN